MAAKLPKGIASGWARQERRKAGLPPPPATLKSVLRSQVPVRPVLPPPARGPLVGARPPLQAPARLTALNVVQAQRDKARARAIQASPAQAAKAVERARTNQRIAAKAAGVRLIRQNPPSPLGDLRTGMMRYSGAFSAQPFFAPFQRSNNARRAFGA